MSKKLPSQRELAREIINTRGRNKDARKKLLKRMKDNEHFDFNIEDQWYRCRRIPLTTRRKKAFNYETMTFWWVERNHAPYIDIRKINERGA